MSKIDSSSGSEQAAAARRRQEAEEKRRKELEEKRQRDLEIKRQSEAKAKQAQQEVKLHASQAASNQMAEQRKNNAQTQTLNVLKSPIHDLFRSRLTKSLDAGNISQTTSTSPTSTSQLPALAPDTIASTQLTETPTVAGNRPLTTVTEELQVELDRNPPDPAMVDLLIAEGDAARDQSLLTLESMPSDLSLETAETAATELDAYALVLEQASTLPGLDPELQSTAVQSARNARVGVESAEATAAMSAYVRDPSEANFDAYVLEFADVHVDAQAAMLTNSAELLDGAPPEVWADLALSAGELDALHDFVNQNPHHQLAEALDHYNSYAPNTSTLARQYNVDFPITEEGLMNMAPVDREAFMNAISSSAKTVVMSPPPPGEEQPVNAAAEAASQDLFESIDMLQQLQTAGLTYEEASAQAQTQITDILEGYPALGVLDPQAVLGQFLPSSRTELRIQPGGELTPMVLNNGVNLSDPANASGVLDNPRFADVSLRTELLDQVNASAADLRTLRQNLDNANPPPTARDLLPTAGLAMAALVNHLGNPAEASGTDGQPGPLGNAIVQAGGLFERYASEEQSEARRDLVIGLGSAAAGIAAGILSGGTAAPLLIAGLAATSIAGTGYGMYRSTENFFEARDLAQFGELSGVDEPSTVGYLLEMGLNTLGLVADTTLLTNAMRVMRGADATVDVARGLNALSTVDDLANSPMGIRLLDRLGDGATLDEASLAALRGLEAGEYSFDDIARIANQAVTDPSVLSAQELALNDIVRAERLLTDGALDIYRRYQLATGESVDDAYRTALANANGDANSVPRELVEDFVRWNQRPSTVGSARNIVNMADEERSFANFSKRFQAAQNNQLDELPTNVWPQDTPMSTIAQQQGLDFSVATDAGKNYLRVRDADGNVLATFQISQARNSAAIDVHMSSSLAQIEGVNSVAFQQAFYREIYQFAQREGLDTINITATNRVGEFLGRLGFTPQAGSPNVFTGSISQLASTPAGRRLLGLP